MAMLASISLTSVSMAESKLVHDAEYNILETQNRKVWSSEDKQLGKKLAELKAKHGTPPNIVYILWDDMADNGPMIHNPPPGLGMTETIFTGGKGDHTEGATTCISTKV